MKEVNNELKYVEVEEKEKSVKENSPEDRSKVKSKELPTSIEGKVEEKEVKVDKMVESEGGKDDDVVKEETRGPLDFTDRKVIVDNVLKFVKPNQLNAMMDSWLKGHGDKIKISKHKKPAKNNWVLVTLENENMVDAFIAEINSGRHKNKKGGNLRAYKAAEKSRNDKNDGRGGKREASDGAGEGPNAKKMRSQPKDCVKTVDEVRDSLIPMWRLSYEDQLDKKMREMGNKCLSKIIKEIQFKVRTLNKEAKKNKKGPITLYKWVNKRRAVEMNEIIGAPVQTEYRNKCELTVGYKHSYSTAKNEKGVIVKTPAVGFLAGGWSGGVSDPHCLSNIPDEVCGIADIFNEFLQSSSIPPYDAKSHRGIWRQLTIRLSKRTNECMIIILHAPATGGAGKRDDGSDDYTESFDSEKTRIIQMLTAQSLPKPVRNFHNEANKINEDSNPKKSDESGSNTVEDATILKSKEECDTETMDMKVTSIFFQEYSGLSNPPPEHPCQHAYGKSSIDEKLGNCSFQISPGAFFQVTTDGAEVLYDVVVKYVKEVTEKPNETILFDVCCGTGTIGLTCMKEGAVGKVVGIDISEPAIKDAKINAHKNGFSDSDDIARFIASRAEAVMSEETQKVDCPMVAVVDPARDGLHTDVLRALRNKRKIKRIVYVSCNPTGSLIRDAATLCSPPTKKFREAPFKITSAQPVDMFPYTSHCEMVLVFDRMSEEQLAFENGTESTD